MAASGHFGCSKITFDLISGHFRSIQVFLFYFLFFTKWLPVAILDFRKSLSISFLAISDRYATLFFDKMAAVGHFGCPKFSLDHISGHFRSIQIFYFFYKMAAGGHFGCPKITFDLISIHLTSIHKFFLKFLTKWLTSPIWMSVYHFRSHFWPFQIDTEKKISAAILDV